MSLRRPWLWIGVGLIICLSGFLLFRANTWVRSTVVELDSRLHPFQYRRDAYERPAVSDLLVKLRALGKAAPRDPAEVSNWHAWLHYDIERLPDMSLPPKASDVSLRSFTIIWMPIEYRDASERVYCLRLSGVHKGGALRRTALIQFADGKTETVGMSPFEWNEIQRLSANKYFYSDFWQAGHFGHKHLQSIYGDVGHIDWESFDWILVYPESLLQQQGLWVYPAELRDVVYYQVRTDARGYLVEGIVGIPRHDDGVYTLKVVVEGVQERLQLRRGQPLARWGYHFEVVEGGDLLKQLR